MPRANALKKLPVGSGKTYEKKRQTSSLFGGRHKKAGRVRRQQVGYLSVVEDGSGEKPGFHRRQKLRTRNLLFLRSGVGDSREGVCTGEEGRHHRGEFFAQMKRFGVRIGKPENQANKVFPGQDFPAADGLWGYGKANLAGERLVIRSRKWGVACGEFEEESLSRFHWGAV